MVIPTCKFKRRSPATTRAAAAIAEKRIGGVKIGSKNPAFSPRLSPAPLWQIQHKITIYTNTHTHTHTHTYTHTHARTHSPSLLPLSSSLFRALPRRLSARTTLPRSPPLFIPPPPVAALCPSAQPRLQPQRARPQPCDCSASAQPFSCCCSSRRRRR